MNVVLIIPTGIGAEIGGHNGDANPVAKLIGSVCDTLILHPNVVNASDINEMPANALYVEGSILDRFLRGEIGLKRVKSNRILLVSNDGHPDTINMMNAARVTLGADIRHIILDEPLRMDAVMHKDGTASGVVSGVHSLTKQVDGKNFDALAVHTPIGISKEVAESYLCNGGVNPWGGVEALASSMIAAGINKPVAHAPFGDTLPDFSQVVNPRIAPEMVSVTYLFSVLKGLYKAPRIDLNPGCILNTDMDCMISPYACFGPPHSACLKNGIPIIFVKGNKTCLTKEMPEDFISVNNYLEAAGMINCMNIGISANSVLSDDEKR